MMADRIIGMRAALRHHLESAGSTVGWNHITDQVGGDGWMGGWLPGAVEGARKRWKRIEGWVVLPGVVLVFCVSVWAELRWERREQKDGGKCGVMSVVLRGGAFWGVSIRWVADRHVLLQRPVPGSGGSDDT